MLKSFGRLTKLSRMNAARKNSSLTPKKAAKHAENSNVSDVCRLCGINFKISVGDFGNRTTFANCTLTTFQLCDSRRPRSEKWTSQAPTIRPEELQETDSTKLGPLMRILPGICCSLCHPRHLSKKRNLSPQGRTRLS